MSRLWPTLFDIAKTMRAELSMRPGRPGERTYRHSRLRAQLVLWYDGDEVWKLTVRRAGDRPEDHVVKFARAAFDVPDEAVARPFARRERSAKTGRVILWHGIDLIWREVV